MDDQRQKITELVIAEVGPLVTKLVATIPASNQQAYLGLCTALEIVAQHVLAGGIAAGVPAGQRSLEFVKFRSALQRDAQLALVEAHSWLALAEASDVKLLDKDGNPMAPTPRKVTRGLV